jgi:hypothetical protein
MSATRQTLKIQGRTLPLLALVLSLVPGCITEPDTVDNDTTNTIVQVVNMAASSVDFDGVGEAVSDLYSDVCFADLDHPPCTTFNDNGVVTMRAILKDNTQVASVINDVTFERYRVTFVRADGRNVAGVDVPYPFDGAINFTVRVTGEEFERGFLLVRHQAKAESPLRELTQSAFLLSVIAQIDFYGRDGAGRTIQVTGYMNVTFGDFGNE